MIFEFSINKMSCVEMSEWQAMASQLMNVDGTASFILFYHLSIACGVSLIPIFIKYFSVICKRISVDHNYIFFFSENSSVNISTTYWPSQKPITVKIFFASKQFLFNLFQTFLYEYRRQRPHIFSYFLFSQMPLGVVLHFFLFYHLIKR